MVKLSKGFFIFSIATLVVLLLVVVLTLFVFEDKEDLQPVASITFENKKPIKVENNVAKTNLSTVQETKKIELVRKVEVDSDVTTLSKKEDLLALPVKVQEEKQEEKQEENMPPKISTTPEDEMLKEFEITVMPANIPEPLDLIEPRSDLMEKRASIYLPKIAKNGDEPWKVYARPLPEDAKEKTKIAIVVYGLGMKSEYTELAITKLPPDVTLSFSPYAENVAEQVAKARTFGHEVMMDLPMEDSNFPTVDGGPNTILKSASLMQNEQKIKDVLKNAGAFSGVVAIGGSGLLEHKEVLNSVYKAIADRGLLFLETEQKAFYPEKHQGKGAYIKADKLITENFFESALKKYWQESMKKAKEKGGAVIIFPPNPIVFDSILDWYKENTGADKKDIIPAPLTALIRNGNAE